MCTGMIYNLVRKLTEDKEDILASREKSLASLAMAESYPDIPSPTKSRGSRGTSAMDCNGCYVPPPPGNGCYVPPTPGNGCYVPPTPGHIARLQTVPTKWQQVKKVKTHDLFYSK